MSNKRRPEHTAPAELYYDKEEAKKYTSNTRIMEIQSKLSERALELLALPDDKPCLILDLGCGSGLSGEVLSDNGHYWIGMDISEAMLNVCVERESEGDTILSDMGNGAPFRAGSFDGVISISAVQWLCNADKKSHNPVKRLYRLFSTLYASMSRGARAVFQLYPETPDQLELITQQAMKAGFSGGVVVDYPNSTKAKKIFLCLFTGGAVQQLPKGLSDENDRTTAIYENKRERLKEVRGKPLKKSRQWVLEKKARHRRQGKEERPDTKYTGRKRPHAF